MKKKIAEFVSKCLNYQNVKGWEKQTQWANPIFRGSEMEVGWNLMEFLEGEKVTQQPNKYQ